MLRIGIALQMDINLPLKEIEGASFRRFGDGSGDLPLCSSPACGSPTCISGPMPGPGA